MRVRVNYVERKFHYFVSVEKVFRQIVKGLNAEEFDVSFENLPYLNNLSGMIKNLIFFRPTLAADVYHVTGDCHYIAMILPGAKTVLTVHDLRFLHVRTGLRRWVLKKILLDLPLKRLKYITAISSATKDEILKYAAADFDARKITVIENPLDEFFFADEEKEFNEIEPNILQIGTSVNKNVVNLIRALDGLNCRLTIVGELNDELKNLLSEKKIRFEVKSKLDDAAMRGEYERADLTAFCSVYEGFGLPVIESQAMRTPVLTSDISPLREVAGAGGAILVNPHDYKDIRRGVEQIINDANLRARLLENGLKNVERFRSAAIAEKYAALYRRMVNENSDIINL